MTTPTSDPLASHPTEPQWDQTSFLAEDADSEGSELTPVAPRAVLEALGAADHAADHTTRRKALDRLARHLTEQAVRRGRTPVPKHVLRDRARGG